LGLLLLGAITAIIALIICRGYRSGCCFFSTVGFFAPIVSGLKNDKEIATSRLCRDDVIGATWRSFPFLSLRAEGVVVLTVEAWAVRLLRYARNDKK